MRVRIKFTKNGPVKFIGHLDVMRYFQKALRRAQIPVALSGGFSPHMLMSFAAPLGVGITSDGEYFDVDLTSELSSEELVARLNAQMAEGITVKNAVRIGETKADKGMTVVAAAEYTVRFRPGKFCFPPAEETKRRFREFLDKDSIIVMRKTKRSEAETDIKPWIYSAELLTEAEETAEVALADASGYCFHMLLSSGSVHNLKPELVVQAFAAELGIEMPEYSMMIHRNDVYADNGAEGERHLVPLDALGERIPG